MSKLSIVSEFWDYLKIRKKWWLFPIVFFLVLLGALHSFHGRLGVGTIYLRTFLRFIVDHSPV